MRTWVAPLILAMALTGCQDDSTNSGSTSKPGLPEYGGGGKLNPNLPANQIQGQLVDPYVADALVCLDISDNGACDSGEPKTRSDANGVFTFTLGSALSSAAQILVINEGTLQYPHYGRHVGNDFHIALNGKLAKGNNSIIITPAVAALAVMATDNVLGPTPEVLASVLNENFGTYFGVEFTADDLEVDPYAQMITTDHARFVEVQKAQQVIAGLLLIFQNLRTWDGYDDFVSDFAANAATPETTTSEGSDGTVTSTKRKPLYEILEVLIKQANIVSSNVLPVNTTGEESLYVKSDAYIKKLHDDFASVMPSAIDYKNLPLKSEVYALSDSHIANMSALFYESFIELLNKKLIARFVEADENDYSFVVRLATLADTVVSFSAIQKTADSAVYAELISKVYLSSSDVQSVLNGYTNVQLNLLGGLNEYYESVANCQSKRFYFGYKAVAADSSNRIGSLSASMVCSDDILSNEQASQLLSSYGLSVDVGDYQYSNMPQGEEAVSKHGCSIEGSLVSTSTSTVNYYRNHPVYLKNAQTGRIYSQLTDTNGKFSFTGLEVPDAVDGFSGYLLGSYAGVHGGYSAINKNQSFKNIPVVCVDDQISEIDISLDMVSSTTQLNGVVDVAVLGEGFNMFVERSISDFIDGDNTLADDGIESVWIGETIEDDPDSLHPYMEFDKNTGAFNLTNLAAGSYRLKISVGAKPGRGAYEVYSPFFNIQSDKTNKITVNVDDATKQVTLTVILTS
ncbi:MAG: hypothetical protein H7A08_04470 [Oceanospirillaceae bacterium]|nr:hypothetical protein [Oceanospirillaceae bacterium]MCP5349601.1 hypothetical protein [Oceanospirillaceae bacterium]